MNVFTGKDNYQADIKDDGEGFDTPVKNFDGTQKNVGYYHRYFDTGLRDAMGNTKYETVFSFCEGFLNFIAILDLICL